MSGREGGSFEAPSSALQDREPRSVGLPPGGSLRSLVISPTEFVRQPRQQSMAHRLVSLGTVTVASSGPRVEGFEWIAIPGGLRERSRPEKLRLLAEACFGRPKVSTNEIARHESVANIDLNSFDVVTVHDLDVLAAVVARSPSGAVIFDAREYYPEEQGDLLKFRFLHTRRLRRHCRELFKRCDAVFTVSDGIAEHYANITGVRPDVVLSTKRARISSVPTGRPSARIRLLYHGGSNGDRSIEGLIELAGKLDERFELDLYLVGEPDRIATLRQLASGTRCTIHDPVPTDRLVELGAQYDVGLVLFEPKHINLRHTMPNKLFEYMNAGLAVMCGPLEDAGRMVNEGSFGIVLDSTAPEVVARVLNGLSRAQIDTMRRAAFTYTQTVNAEREDRRALSAIQRAVESKASTRSSTVSGRDTSVLSANNRASQRQLP